MKVVGLDISTKSGFAVAEIDTEVRLIRSGTFFRDKDDQGVLDDYPKSMMAVVENAGEKVVSLIEEEKPDVIVIEETNLGRNRFSQKTLEWLHHYILERVLSKYKVEYISTSEWRATLQIKMTKEDKEHNKRIKENGERGKTSQKHLAIRFVNETMDMKLKPKNEDEADAICLVLAFHKRQECLNKTTKSASQTSNKQRSSLKGSTTSPRPKKGSKAE